MSYLQTIASNNPPEYPPYEYGFDLKTSPEESGLPLRRIESSRERYFEDELTNGYSKAFSFADPNSEIGVYASSKNIPPFLRADANGIFVLDYSVEGNGNNIPIPITFNMRIEGGLNAYSPDGFALADIGFGATLRSDDALEIIGGSAERSSESGVLYYKEDGVFFNIPSTRTTIIPKLVFPDFVAAQTGVKEVPLDDLANLLPEPLRTTFREQLVQPFTYNGFSNADNEATTLANYDSSFVISALNVSEAVDQGITAGQIIEEIIEKYLPADELLNIALDLAKGSVLPILKPDVTTNFDIPIKLSGTTIQNGNIAVSLGNSAYTLGGQYNQATSDFSKTLRLEAITVPKTFTNIDPLQLKIRFDDNREEPVFPEVNGNIIKGFNENNNNLRGSALDDIIRGGQGNDLITGLQGNDYLEGGLGKDQFIFGIGKPFDSSIGIDTILDFNAADDKIVLEKTTFSALGTQVSFALVNTLQEAETSSSLITYISGNGSLYYNLNGVEAGFGDGGQFARLANQPILAASNFGIV